MSKKSKNDMYTVIKAALEESDDMTKNKYYREVMNEMSSKAHDHDLSFADLRDYADKLSYEDILGLIDADDVFDLVNGSNDKLLRVFREIIDGFLASKNLGKRRAML